MYTKYTYSTNNTTDICADLTALFTGETNPSNLSATCVSAAITTTTVAGWTLHDQINTTTVVIKAPYSDNTGFNKYIKISVLSDGISIIGYETWNATTHVGTFETTNPVDASARQPINVSGGDIHIAATAKYLFILAKYASTWGDSINGGALIASEYSRKQKWNTAGNNYPNFCIIHSQGFSDNLATSGVFFPRIKANDGSDISGVAKLSSIGVSPDKFNDSSSMPTGATSKTQDAIGEYIAPILPIWLQNNINFGSVIGEISSLSDLWLAPNTLFSDGEVLPLSDTGQNYIALRASTNQKYLVKQA